MGILLSCLNPPNYKQLNSDFEHVIRHNEAEFNDYISYKNNRDDLHRSVNCFGQNYLIVLSQYNSFLLGLVCTSNKFVIEKRDLLHADNNGLTALFYIVTNPHISLGTVNKLIKTKAFSSNISQIFSHVNKLDQNFIVHSIESKKLNEKILCKLIECASASFIESPYIKNTQHSILSYLLQANYPSLVDVWVEKLSKLNGDIKVHCGIPYKYKDVVHMGMEYGNEYLIPIIRHKLYTKLGINIKNNKYNIDKYNNITVFSYCCKNDWDIYVKYALDNKLYSRDCIEKNIFHIMHILPNDEFVMNIKDGIFPHTVLTEEDENGDTLFCKSIISSQSIHKKLLEEGLITTSNLKFKNYSGNNCIILAAMYDVDFLPFLYMQVKNNPDILFTRNYQGADFMDVLTSNAQLDSFYYMHFFPIEMYDNKQNIMYKFSNGIPLNVDEYTFLHYQYNLTASRLNPDDIEEEFLCIICMTDIMHAKFNCDHTVCFRCSLLVNSCPLCRAHINKKTLLVDV